MEWEFSFSPDLVPPSVRTHVNYFQNILVEYKNAHDFLNECVNSDSCSSNCDTNFKGMYVEAFCVGALTVLQSMSDNLVKIKNYVVNYSDSLSWLYILNECEDLGCILPSLNAAIEMIKNGKYRACKILDLCDKFIDSGLPAVKCFFNQVQQFCLKKLYMQTKWWIMQGILHDPLNEFFIRSAKITSVSQDTSVNTAINSIQSGTLINTGVTSLSCATLMTRATNSDMSSRIDSLKNEIIAENLPSLIPFSVAIKILFIGEALIMCQGNRGNQSVNNLLEECGISEDSLISEFIRIENSGRFLLHDFSTLINGLWIKINRRIRDISEETGNVSYELVLMSDIYLLGRGDLFQEFLMKASHLLSADVSTVSPRSLNIALREAFCNVYSTDISDLIDNFSFEMPHRKYLKPGIKSMTVISLTYNVKWPLHYLFTRDVMKNYNKLFRFLLALKKAQITLTSVCKPINSIKNHSLKTEFIEVRMHLLSMVVNLQNYCLTYVVAHNMTILLNDIKTADMFTDLQKVFSSFLCNISNRLFITNSTESSDWSTNSKTTLALEEINRKVHYCFLKIFTMSDSFAELLSTEIEENAKNKLSCIKADLYKVFKILFSLLKKIDENYWYDDDCSAGYLYHLIMCLDFNRFYQKKFQV